MTNVTFGEGDICIVVNSFGKAWLGERIPRMHKVITRSGMQRNFGYRAGNLAKDLRSLQSHYTKKPIYYSFDELFALQFGLAHSCFNFGALVYSVPHVVGFTCYSIQLTLQSSCPLSFCCTGLGLDEICNGKMRCSSSSATSFMGGGIGNFSF